MTAMRDALREAGLPIRQTPFSTVFPVRPTPKITFAKLTPGDVRDIRACIRQGMPSADIADDFNVSKSTIEKIRYGFAWTHVTDEEEHAA